MDRIFISYRRADSAPYAALLATTLDAHYGGGRVFYDVESISPGVDFAEARARRLEISDVVLVVIGPRWLSTLDPVGRRRLDAPDDFVRLEVADALRARKRVIPVLVGGAYMPRPEELSHDLRQLAFINALQLSDEAWDEDVRWLIRVLDGGHGPPVTPPSRASEEAGGPRPGVVRHFLHLLRLIIGPPLHPTSPASGVAGAPRPQTPPAAAPSPPDTEDTARITPARTFVRTRPAVTHDVFVSHASRDRGRAEEVVAALEKGAGLRCWVSYRDIQPGTPSWAGAIVDAIARSRLVVVVVSQHAIASADVLRELTIADDEKIPFIAFCIDDAPLSNNFRYYLSVSQRLQAGRLTPPEALARLAASARSLVSGTA